MAALPYMPLFVADYMADAAHLTTIQHGAYLLMLMNYWQRGKPLPNDDAQLARIARLGRKEWNANKAELRAFFYEEENLLVHRRVEAELTKVQAKSLKCKKAAQASVQRRFGERSTDAEQTLNHTDTDTSKKDSFDEESNAEDVQFVDPETVMWRHGRLYLQSQGVSAEKAGSLLGKWKRDFGAAAVIVALGKAQREGAIDCVSFITGCLKAGKTDASEPRIGALG